MLFRWSNKRNAHDENSDRQNFKKHHMQYQTALVDSHTSSPRLHTVRANLSPFLRRGALYQWVYRIVWEHFSRGQIFLLEWFFETIFQLFIFFSVNPVLELLLKIKFPWKTLKILHKLNHSGLRERNFIYANITNNYHWKYQSWNNGNIALISKFQNKALFTSAP